MKQDIFYKHAGFAIVAAAIAFSAGTAQASDQGSWIWKDRGDHRVAIVAPAPDVVYRSAPYRVVISQPVTRRIIYTRPAIRRVVYTRPVVRKVVYARPTLFSTTRTVRYYTAPRVTYVSGVSEYIPNAGYLEYR